MKKDIENDVCVCNHTRHFHGKSTSINYTEGRCSECKCQNFIMKGKEKKEDLVFEKCYKVNCSPSIEVFKDRINYFGYYNQDIESFKKSIKHAEQDVERRKKTLAVWERYFSKEK